LQEKELRIALVCFGGVSLAVYMHGISKEVLKLIRASRALHAITDRQQRLGAAFFDAYDWNDPEFDTEPIYFELLREIGRSIELRVIVDIIAGASAGGINGTMLARAISHDLRMGKLRDLWLDNADVTELLAPDARARRWSKAFLQPVFWAAGAARIASIRDREVRNKLSMFVRSRWFKPPLDGTRMAELMYDAALAMGEPVSPTASLLPSGHGLDLFVTVTDFYGHQNLIQIHDPPIIQDREHRHLLRFKYRRNAAGQVDSDFHLVDAPALAFAARATSSFPGAFPPAQIIEIDRVVAARGDEWPRRAAFLGQNFEHYILAGRDPAIAPFIDGSVLNNRPFQEAITSIRGRPAFRQVDRRVVYIDPDPATPAAGRQGMPGFFATLKGAMSDIPRAEPVTDALNWIVEFNERARRLRSIVESARPQISGLVAAVMTEPLDRPPDEAQIRAWREQANSHVARDAGFAYEGYVRLKLAAVRDFVTQMIMDVRRVRPKTPFARAIAETIDAWATQAGAVYDPSHVTNLRNEAAQQNEPLPRWVTFLLAFDVDYRRRRLHFLIQGLNRLYGMIGSGEVGGIGVAAIDRLKRQLYDCLDVLHQRETATMFDPETRALVVDIFLESPSAGETREIQTYGTALAQRHREKLDRLIDQLAAEVDLDSSTRDVDTLLADMSDWSAEVRRDVLVNYLGFPFWDVLTFPVMTWREVGEFNEILVDRISPRDARAVNRLGDFPLKGTGFEHFAAFLSRAYRENDYLLGRLHALDRLIDIVCNAAGFDIETRPELAAIKQRGLLQILAAEAPHLPNISPLVGELRRHILEARAPDEAAAKAAVDLKSLE
jgi:patatin-related protein